MILTKRTYRGRPRPQRGNTRPHFDMQRSHKRTEHWDGINTPLRTSDGSTERLFEAIRYTVDCERDLTRELSHLFD